MKSSDPRLACIAAFLAIASGCTSFPPDGPRAEPPAGAEPAAARGRFAVPGVTMLDTWNAVGQILVRLDGVTYQGRSQMLGLYDVRYRGEPLLIVTRARVMQGPADGMVTEVDALQQDGKPSDSAAGVELLHLLRQRLPEELARIEAGGR